MIKIFALISLVAISAINCDNFNETLTKISRVKRQLSDECGVPYHGSGFISGGKNIKRGDFPWMVAIMQRWEEKQPPRYICTGTIISPKRIVTAAHCLYDKDSTATKAREIVLYLGAFDLDDFSENGRVSIVPAEIMLHDGWNPFILRFTDDIAYFNLENEIQFTKYIRPICLTTEDFEIDEGFVVGWGKDDKSLRVHENIPKVLRIPIVSDSVCFRTNPSLAKLAWEKSFCAGESGIGVCMGDSGGSFFVKFNGKSYFRGFVSSSIRSDSGCYTVNFAVYTDVIEYAEFLGIKKTLKVFETTTSKPATLALTSASTTARTSSKPNSNSTCGVMSDESSLVVGGKLSTREQFPWLVAIFVKSYGEFQHKGSGSLISNRHVVSEAFSVAYVDGQKYFRAVTTDRVKVYLGTTKYQSIDEPGAIETGVSKISVYPGAQYLRPRIFDITVITFSQPVPFSSVISPICLRSFNDRNDAGQTVFGVGYGYDQNLTDTGVKKHVKMTIDSNERCKSFYEKELNDGKASQFFCVKGSKDNAPFYYDDPVYMKVDGDLFLRGMFNIRYTFDNGTLATEDPFFYEDISMFVDWIEEQTKE